MEVIYRWDLDKTYLNTEFDTIRDLLRTALEPAALKEAIPGATSLLRAIQNTGPREVSIVSGSPEQMRSVLEAKLRLDGIRWDTLVLKPSLDNLLRGRFHFLRDQIGYKLGALLRSRQHSAPFALEVLFGDDAEADSLIYSLYADLLRGRVDAHSLGALMNEAELYPDQRERILEDLDSMPNQTLVKRIFIRLDRLSSTEHFAHLGQRVAPIYNYFQGALILLEDGLLGASDVFDVGHALFARHDMHPEVLHESFSDLRRRNFLTRHCGETLLAHSPRNEFEENLLSFVNGRLENLPLRIVDAEPDIDYLHAFHIDARRRHDGKKRAQHG